MTRKRLLSFSLTLLLPAAMAFACAAPTNDAVQAGLSKDLAKYPGVTVKVDDCMATLSGSVDRYTDKLAAYHKAHHYGALTGIVNKISVAGPAVPDQELAKKLASGLAYDQSMRGNAFDWFTVDVHNGAVTLSGYAHNPWNHDSAVGLVESAKGVKDVVDKVEVLPVSMFDDRIRIAAFRRIYGGSSFAGAMDPAHPIRIIVDNGHVTLEGVVISSLDKQMAGMKVSAMSGVFSVQNDLLVKKG